jgi:hypothetical protein
LPKDADKGASALLRRMTENPKFRSLALPDFDETKPNIPDSDETKPNSYDEWTANPMVAAIESVLTQLAFCDQQLRERLVSLLSDYPKNWIKSHFASSGCG